MRWIAHLLLAAVAVLVLWAVRRRKDPRTTTIGVGLLVLTGALLSVILAPFAGFGFFAIARLWRDVIFVVLPIFLTLAGWILPERRHRLAVWTAAGALASVGAWATFVEPRWLEVSRHTIHTTKLTQPLRIVLVSDLQTDEWTAWERRVVDEIVVSRPDLVLFSGDYVQAGGKRRTRVTEALRRELRRVGEASSQPFGRLGAWAVGGDVEAPGWSQLFAGTGVQTLEETARVELDHEVILTALSLHDSRAPLQAKSAIAPEDAFHIILGHAPDYALGHPPADLLLAGHVHGGQVRVPILGPLFTLSAVPRDWAVGRTDFADGRVLIVSRGIGMERGQAPRLRFLCRPELVVVDVVPTGG